MWDRLDQYFMTEVYRLAELSPDPSTKVGAVIVSPYKDPVSTGYNTLPRGADMDRWERLSPPLKYKWMVHAEQNAIINAGRLGRPVMGYRMYTNGTPCMNCAGWIVNAGIAEVIVHKAWNDLCRGMRGYWVEDLGMTEALFRECGIALMEYDDPITMDLSSRLRGTDVLREGE